MKVVLDTNIVVQDYHLRSPHFRVFLDGLTVIPATLHIPEVVVDEVVNRFREELEQKLEAARRARSELGKILGSGKRFRSPTIDVEEEVSNYRHFLSEKLEEQGAEILPYPDVPHKRIVARDLARRKPFKRDGSGYRDFLIWESVQTLMLIGAEHVSFITNNPKDFGEGPRVDPDLQEDILNPHRLTLYRSLRDFNEALVLPRLRSLEDVRRRLQEEKLKTFDVRA